MPRVSSLRVWVHEEYAESRVIALAAIQQLLQTAGFLTVESHDAAQCDVAYAPERGLTVSRDALFIRGIPPAAWRGLAASAPLGVGGVIVPDGAVVEGGKDPVAVTAFMMSGMYENDRSVLDCDDVWGAPGEGARRWGVHLPPVVDLIAAEIGRAVVQQLGLAGAPRFPRRCSWALVLTHDLDRLQKYRPGEFLMAAARHGRRNARVAARSIAGAVVSIALRATKRDPYRDSLDRWIRVQRDLGIRSAIYASVVPRTASEGAPEDVTYNAANPAVQQMLRSLAKDGFEVSLHSSLNAWRREEGFSRERAILESILDMPVPGVRGHYWSLDPNDRSESMRRIARAGFMYDSSLGMNVLHGTRRGTAYPFQPFDPVDGGRLGVWELPPVMMDQSLYLAAPDNSARLEVAKARRDVVRSAGGVLVLDWHTDSFSSGYMDDSITALLPILTDAAADPSCWVTTPGPLIEWCHEGRWQR